MVDAGHGSAMNAGRARARAGAPVRDFPASWVFAGIFVTFFLIAALGRYPGEIHHDTAEIYMWSRLGFPLTLPKHPPLLPWLFRIWFAVLPAHWLSIMALTALNVTVGAYATWRAARLVLDERRAAVALVLVLALPFETISALKLNHNAILVSLWPLAIWAYLAALKRPDVTRGLILGVIAAAAMLAKYYSGLLLGTFVIASLLDRQGRAAYRTWAPYVAVATCVLLLLPHVWASYVAGQNDVAYAFHTEGLASASPLGFFLSTAAMLLPEVLVALGLGLVFAKLKPQNNGVAPMARDRLWLLGALAVGPFLMTLAFVETFSLKGSTNWTIPAWSALPILLAGTLPVPSDRHLDQIRRALLPLAVIAVLVAPMAFYASFHQGRDEAVEPDEEAGLAAAELWNTVVQGSLRIVGGEIHASMNMSFALASHPLVLSDFSFQTSTWLAPKDLATFGSLFLCRDAVRDCRSAIEAVGPGQQLVGCSFMKHRRFLFSDGPSFSYTATLLAPMGVAIDKAVAIASCSNLGGQIRL